MGRRYKVILSQDAEIDLQAYIDYILFDCKAPLTALKHYENLFDTLKSLECFPKSYPIQTGSSFSLFGTNVRRINYKKMAIVYTVHGDTVYIHRIVAANLFTSI